MNQPNPHDLDAAYGVKLDLANRLADTLFTTALRKREFYGNEPLPTWDYAVVAGPRAARIAVRAGLGNDRLYQRLTEKRMGKLRALFSAVGWGLSGDPSVDWVGDDLVIEALFPAGLQVTKTYLTTPGVANLVPQDGLTAVLGVTENWRYGSIQYSGMDAHGLYVGRSGGGKTTTLYTILTQLAHCQQAQFALLDGKGGGPESLEPLGRLNGLVGPIGYSIADALAISRYVSREVERRRSAADCEHPFHLVVDEFHVYTQVAEFCLWLDDYGRRARSKNMHLHLGTQRSDASVWGVAGKTLQGQCGNIVFHKMSNAADVTTVTGLAYPPAHTLAGEGDVFHKSERRGVQRLQVAMPAAADFARVSAAAAPTNVWAQQAATSSRYSPAQQCAAVYVAGLHAADPRTGGRGTLQDLLERIGAPERSNDTADDLLDLGRVLHADFTAHVEKKKER